MNKQNVISFFDKHASSWDEMNFHNDSVKKQILHFAGVEKDVSLLDVACGTGVLFDEYIKRGVVDFTAIDISPEMVKKARSKYVDTNIFCGDAEEYSFGKLFDCIVIFNAFPHFVNPHKIFKNLYSQLKVGGRLTVAHGASRKNIIKCHSGDAKNISNILPIAEYLAQLMGEYVIVDTVISDEEKYIVSGVKSE